MKAQERCARRLVSAAAIALILAACGGDNTETLLSSGRDYLAKNDPKAAAIQLKNALQKDPSSAEARFLLGKALLQSGDAVGAEVELRKSMDGRYPADQTIPLLAQAMLATGQAKKVLSDLAKIELTTPDAKADVQTSVAMAHAALGDMDKARLSVDAALSVKPDYSRAMIAKTRLLLAARDIPGALGILDAILAKDAKNHEAWGLKGDILTSQGKSDEALSAYRKAVEAKPDFASAYSAIVSALTRQDKLEEAGAQLDAMKKALPRSPQVMLVEAEYLYQKRDFKRAMDVVQDLLRAAPENPRVLLLAGALQFQLNSFAQAEDSLTRVLKKAPDATQARRLLAAIYLRTGQPAKALAVVEPILDRIDNDSALLSLAGDIYMQNGNPKKAEEFFNRSAALDPTNARKQTKVALTHLVEGKGESALVELERIASADSGSTADMALISTALRNKDFVKALKAVDALEKKQGGSPLVYTLRGVVQVSKGDVATGRKSLEKAIATKPDYFPAAASLANLDLAENKPDEAKTRFESVLSADPKNLQAGLALAELKARTGTSPDDVAAQISKTIQANPGELAPRLALVRLYLQNKDAKKAVAAAQDAVAAMPDRVELLDVLTRAQQVAGETNQALATCARLVSLMPGSPQPYLRMAEINAAAKNTDAAVQDLRKALDLKPDLVVAQRGLIQLYLGIKNFQEAQRVAAEVKQQRPKEAVGFLFEGDIAMARQAWPDAVTAYRNGLRAVSGNTELAMKLHSALRASGKNSEADKFAAGWLSDHPKDAGFRLVIAENAIAQKDYPNAVRHYQTLLQAQPNNPVLLNNLAWVLGQLKDPKALDYAEKAYRLAPNQPGIMETMGTLLADKGEVTRALDILQKALELAPQSATVKLSLARAQLKAGKRDEARTNLDELAALGDKFPEQAEVGRLLKEVAK